MPFFLPSRLIDFEYFGQDEPDEEYEKVAKGYQDEIAFAFFVVHFGYTKSDYEALTPKEKLFIYKAWETKTVSDNTHFYNAVFTATYNAQRPKNKKALSLWRKKQKKLNKEVAKENLKLITNIEERDGKSWVDLIYKANGMKKRGSGSV